MRMACGLGQKWWLSHRWSMGFCREHTCFWLVVEPTPLKNDGVRQLGWLSHIYIYSIYYSIYIYPIYIPLFHIYPYKNKTCSKPPTRFSEFSLHIWIPSLPSRYKFRHPQYRIDCCDFMTSFVDFYIFIYPFEDMTMYIAARVWRYLYGCGSFCPGRSNKIPKKRTMPTKVVIGCTYTEFWWILMTDTACCSALGVRQNAL